MPKIIIDGKEIEFKQGQTIIEAAKDHGIEIPHFCWHPKLSVSGNCRMCLVEVEKMPKLVIACATVASDGMVVHTESPKAIAARNAVMEFLLINHPWIVPFVTKLVNANFRITHISIALEKADLLKKKFIKIRELRLVLV